MGNTAIGWINLLKPPAVLSAGSSAANMGIGNIVSDQGAAATAWQTGSGVVTPGGGSSFSGTPSSGGQTWRAMGIFRTNMSAAATVTFQLYNNPSTLVSSSVVTAIQGQAVVMLAADTVADYATVSINDPGNTDGFINVPLSFAGPMWLPKTGAGFASTMGRDDKVNEAVTRGGQEYPVLYWQRRRYNLDLAGVRASEVWPQIDQLELVARTGVNVLLIPDVTDPFMVNAALFGRLKPTADISYPYMGADRRAWKATITERL